MEATSQVILRNRENMGEGPVLLVDAPADGMVSALHDAGLAVRASNQEFGAFKSLSAQGLATAFEAVPSANGDEALVVLRLPREKERLAMVLHALAASMNPDARLWVVGEKRAGINSATRLLETRFATVRKLDSARHCSLLSASCVSSAAAGCGVVRSPSSISGSSIVTRAASWPVRTTRNDWQRDPGQWQGTIEIVLSACCADRERKGHLGSQNR